MHTSPGGAATLTLSLSLLSCSLPAQGTIVSPAAAATAEGQGSNAFPWTTTTALHYLQIHSDLGSTARLFKKIAGRQNGTTTVFTGTRAIDMELYVGESVAWNQAQFTFAKNYVGTRTQVVTRQVLNFGPFTAGTPAPFEFGVPFSTPVPYS